MEKDIPWLFVHLKTASNGEEQQRWALLIEKLAGWFAPTQLDALISETQEYPSLGQALEKLKADYPEKERRRREWQHERHVEPPKPAPHERVAKLLDECENKDSAAWWLLNREMTLEPTSTHYGNEFHSDLTTLPGWKSADKETRVRILAAAKKFLLEQGPNTPEWLGKTNVVYYPALAGYRALELLWRESPDTLMTVPPDIWKKWAPAIPTFPNKGSSSDERHGQLMRLAYQHAPDEIIQTVLTIIDEENQAHGQIFITFQLRPYWDERLSNAMFGKLNDPNLKPNSVGCLLRDLLNHENRKARSLAESLVSHPSFKDAEERSKAIMSAEALLLHADGATWSTVWPVMQKDMEFGKAVVTAVACGSDRHGTSVAQKLSEEQLADLYLWLERNHPHSEDPHEEGAHSVTDRESIGHWRDGLLQHLKNRGTLESVRAMQRIVQELPELHWLQWTLLETRDMARRGTWVPPRPADVIKLVASQQAPMAPDKFNLPLVVGVISFAVGVGGNLIAGWIQQDVLGNTFAPVGVITILISTLIGIGIGIWLQNRSQRTTETIRRSNTVT